MARAIGKYERFIGIDWSGAKGPSLKGLQVAVCEPGKSTPALVCPTDHKYWRRDEVVNWIVKQAAHRRILIGMDFAFAYPFCDAGAYFPGHPESPESPRVLWSKVDSVCDHEANSDFYGGIFYRNQYSPFRKYFRYPGYKGSCYEDRLRETEKVCKSLSAHPSCTFKCVGPAQVGPGSVAGMRALHSIAARHGRILSIWPFDGVSQSKSTLVEIFPRLFFILAGRDAHNWKVNGIVNAVLRHFDSELLSGGITDYSEDKIDALVSAAALRALSSSVDVWDLHGRDQENSQFEGWIFGACNKAQQ